MAAEPMAETGETCGRCGSPLKGEPVVILIQSGPLHASHPVLNLCPSCANSLTRWYVRGQGSSAARPTKSSAPSDRPSHRERHRRRSRRRGRRALTRRTIAVAVVFVVFSIICLILYESFVVLARFL